MPAGPWSYDQVNALVREELSQRLTRRATDAPRVFADESSLSELGIESLDLLELTDALEKTLGVNPFEQTAVTDLRTVRELVLAYVGALGGPSPTSDRDDLLERSRKRAQARQRLRDV